MTDKDNGGESSGTNRRSFIKMALSSPFISRAAQAQGVDKPDVLMIAVDDLNSWVGFLGGHPQTRTPHMDAFAQNAFVFDQAYCPVPYCYPTRVATLWGQDPARSGVYVKEPMGDLASQPSLAARFKKAGYQTHGAGKIYHASPPDPENWDSFAIGQAPRQEWSANSQTPVCAYTGLNPSPDLQTDWGKISDLNDMRDYQYVKRLEHMYASVSEHDQPLFAAVGFHEPHTPYFLPDPYWSPFENLDVVTPDINRVLPRGVPKQAQAWVENPSNFPLLARALCGAPLSSFGDSFIELIRQSAILPELVRGYLASVYFLDDMVARTLALLEASGRADRTVVILWSDHGFHLGEKLHWTKFTLWEEATRVPMVVKVPERYTAGAFGQVGRSGVPVSTLDIAATLADLGCFDLAAPTDSASLLPVMRGEQERRPALMTWGAGSYSIRYQNWRYTLYSKGEEELYDLATDPSCERNLAADRAMAARRADLRHRMIQRTKI